MQTTDVLCGDAIDVMGTLPDASVDCIVTDPPYGLKFLGNKWDHGVPGPPYWEMALRVLKPRGYMFAFGGTRTYHRLTCAIEDVGFEIRDCVMWLYAEGFPKARSCLKPAYEPIILARKKGGKVRHLNIDDCRIPIADDDEILNRGHYVINDKNTLQSYYSGGWRKRKINPDHHPKSVRHHIKGRWPPNVAHDGSDELMEMFAEFGERQGAVSCSRNRNKATFDFGVQPVTPQYGDSGTIARFFYCPKVQRKDNPHPTVKPVELTRWLVRLISAPDDLILDPFCGSGTTGVAARMEGRRFLGIDISPVYVDFARRRLNEPTTPMLFV